MSDTIIPKTPEEWAAWAVQVEAGIKEWEQNGRDAILMRLGYPSYENYLTRALWKRIKKRVWERDDGRCFRCTGPGKHVHHDSYEEAVLKGEDDSKLFLLCEGCHHVVEFRDDGRRRREEDRRCTLRTPDTRTEYPKPKVDLRRDRCFPALPQEWDRMNAVQRQGWKSEYDWFWSAGKHPEWILEDPERFAEQVSRYGLPKTRKQRAKPSA